MYDITDVLLLIENLFVICSPNLNINLFSEVTTHGPSLYANLSLKNPRKSLRGQNEGRKEYESGSLVT